MQETGDADGALRGWVAPNPRHPFNLSRGGMRQESWILESEGGGGRGLGLRFLTLRVEVSWCLDFWVCGIWRGVGA